MDKNVALELWEQIFARLAAADDATIVDADYDATVDEGVLRAGLTQAGWSSAEIERRIEIHGAKEAQAPITSPGIAPHIEAHFGKLCDDVESAMGRLGLQSHARVARGIEPRTGPLAGLTNVIMTDQSILTVGSFLFRFCGLVARAFTRTLRLNPWLWEATDFSQSAAGILLRQSPELVAYWLRIYISFASTGTHALVPFRPANKFELLLFEQIARAMEIFSIAHEYGHHHYAHGRTLEVDAIQEEFEADQFALKMGYEVEAQPLICPNPYLSSGAGGVVLLLALDTLEKCKVAITGKSSKVFGTHPQVSERLSRFDSVAVMRPDEYLNLRGFRIASTRVMSAVDAQMADMFEALGATTRGQLKTLIRSGV